MTRSGSQVTETMPGQAAAWLDDMLKQAAADLRPLAAGRWELRMNGSHRRLRVQIDRDWLCFDSRLRAFPRDLDSGLIDSSLRRNARIDGAARVIGAGGKRNRHVVIDIPTDSLPLDCRADFENLIAALLANLSRALGMPCRDSEDNIARSEMLSEERLETVFSLAEWPLRHMGAGHLAVPFAISGDYFTARLEQAGTGLRMRVPLYADTYRSAPAECRSAFRAMLWLTCSRSRMVKAGLAGRQPWIEVLLPFGLIDGTAVAHGCAALVTTLNRLVDEAVLLLTDERLARLFLELIHFKQPERIVSPRSAVR